MKTQHLKAFVAIVKYGGVIKAAGQLHLTQPALSASLKALERDLGCTLFDRSRGNRRVRLTANGQRFYARALTILRECEVARSELRGEAPPKPRLRLGVLETLPRAWTRSLLAGVRAGDVAVEIWEGSAERLTGWLEQERIDAAVTVVGEKGVDARVLWREPFVAVVPPGHALAARARRTLTIRELAAEPFVFRSRCELSPVGEAQLRAAGTTLRTVVRAAREEVAFDAVERGYGLTFAPRSIVPARLVAVNVSGFSLSRTIGLHWRAGLDRALVERLYRAAARAKKATAHDQAAVTGSALVTMRKNRTTTPANAGTPRRNHQRKRR
ncbi:LysR family transcriptional regulator [Sulfurifustis variabilis]|uniref:LysR family transcriptional regulator n=1 Tax=Sulfurifustis variabilis TaxID=1675686 RepID=A0A1B4V6H0_9GAMM|nr:LysR family transcriptional regulator [Sulfurifustis variabilis]BAU49110.1 LysR family transcriptional regulator [Sulfurifustis variabilis]